ncbi:tRNA lysidine(34) synthetase TilS [Anaerococcus sp. AGMB00486]|uniref:tRNA(Ile)-lysidine synthase n=1 Tax=Anaerococcus faecalis TaxID=2742993 RepID=A0ABX2N8F0_9FIRM|nr:tRNA lysidine(34) synthetase TilS [Anaerococcus faecalis]NVF10970.1 tRNA lysidine(34) synthetase TilS [Anaerococcus faecalis]
MSTKTIINRFLQTIRRENLINKNDTIIVGASGGPDSQFLIYLLNEIKKDYELEIILAHLNHLHRKDAYKDEELVKKTSEDLGLKFYSDHKSMDEYAKEKSLSSEEAGRVLRYKFFERIRKKVSGNKIAIAHNMDDQAETVLMRIIRGTGIEGLRAMDYKNEFIIRPIMDFSKSEIVGYLNEEKIPYHIDYTNLEIDYTRNKIRLDIIPEIEKINPNFKNSLISLSNLAKSDVDILRDIEDKKLNEIIVKKDKNFISFDKKSFESLDKGLRNRILRRSISHINGNINNFSKKNLDDFSQITRLDLGKKIIKNDLIIYKNYKTYDLYKNTYYNKEEGLIFLNIGDIKEFSSYKISLHLVNKEDFKSINKKGSVFFDYELVNLPIKIRSRRSGDSFNFYNNKKKKLKDFFIDEKIDKNMRDKIPLVFINDKLVWIVGLRRSDDYKITHKTKKILMICAEEV